MGGGYRVNDVDTIPSKGIDYGYEHESENAKRRNPGGGEGGEQGGCFTLRYLPGGGDGSGDNEPIHGRRCGGATGYAGQAGGGVGAFGGDGGQGGGAATGGGRPEAGTPHNETDAAE